jgi:glycosyltransferase involved in cell wall biosynthesis
MQNHNPARVLRIIDRLNVGGPAKHVVWLSAAKEDEFQTTLVTGVVPRGEGDMRYFAQQLGVTPIVVDQMSRELGLRDLLVIARLIGLMRRLKPDIVDTHKSKAGAVGRIAAMVYRWVTPSTLLGKPRRCYVVHTYHGHIFHSYYGKLKTRLFLAVERTLARLCTDRILTVSNQQRDEICNQYRVGRPDQYRVIPLGIDFDEARESNGRLRRELGLGNDVLVIGAVGRLCEVKNIAMLLEATAKLARDNPTLGSKLRLVLVGDGHLRVQLEEQAHRLGIQNRVVFTGFRQDAAGVYSDFDLLALTSLNEGTPLTIIEALNLGCAVVATEVGGVVDLMGQRGEQRDGFWVWDHGVTTKSGDSASFARAIEFLLCRPDLRSEMGERGRAFVRAHHSRQRLLNDVTDLYREMAPGSEDRASNAVEQAVRVGAGGEGR